MCTCRHRIDILELLPWLKPLMLDTGEFDYVITVVTMLHAFTVPDNFLLR
jgi:hypothetical protein